MARTSALPGSAFPLVLDVDLTPNPVCSGAVHGRVQVYDPAAAKAGATEGVIRRALEATSEKALRFP